MIAQNERENKVFIIIIIIIIIIIFIHFRVYRLVVHLFGGFVF